MQKLAAAMFAVLTACGGSSADKVAIDQYADTAHDAFCRYLARCGDVEDVDTCMKTHISRTFALTASEQAAVAMGKTRYDGAAAAACLDAAATRDCNTTSQSNRVPPEVCQQVNAGTLHDGESCGVDTECISQFCNVPPCDMACCTGTCSGDTAPGRAKLGEPCENAICSADSFCDDATLMCVALGGPGTFCTAAAQCQYGLDCDQTGACAALPGPGESCTGPCRDEGTTCSSTTGTCVKVGLAGAPCGTSVDCSPVYVCDATKHCSAGIALGQPCAANQPCADDRAFCDVPADQTTGTCAMPKANGATCQGDDNCARLYCDPLTLTCADEPICI
jgi:hypothetical protein